MLKNSRLLCSGWPPGCPEHAKPILAKQFQDCFLAPTAGNHQVGQVWHCGHPLDAFWLVDLHRAEFRQRPGRSLVLVSPREPGTGARPIEREVRADADMILADNADDMLHGVEIILD